MPITMTLSKFLAPTRQQNESYLMYKARRCAGNLYIKYDTIKLVWNSKYGTYRKKKHGN